MTCIRIYTYIYICVYIRNTYRYASKGLEENLNNVIGMYDVIFTDVYNYV